MKRAFDIAVSLAGLLFLLPVFLLVAVAIKLDSPGPVFFRQQRVGKKFHSFRIYKFRTMVTDAPARGGAITFGDDSRITRVGQLLRKTKIDELPQLINVFKGEMSLVGPRPEVLEYVEIFRKDYEQILAIRPGMTDMASLKYRNEAELLGRSRNPQDDYIKIILPEKIQLAKEYVRRSSFLFDMMLILKSLPVLFGYKPSMQ